MNTKWLKIFLVMTLVLTLAISMIACGGKETDEDVVTTETTETEAESEAESTAPKSEDPQEALDTKVSNKGENNDDSWDEVSPF